MTEPMGDEEWRPVEGWPYEVSNLGRVRRASGKLRTGERDGYVLRGTVDRNGYRRVQMKCLPMRRSAFVHQLVARAFIGAPPSEPYAVAHWDGDKLNNHASNLRWATSAENAQDMIRHGRVHRARGPLASTNKLSAEDVMEIRRQRRDGVPGRALARKYNVGPPQIRAIVQRKSWAWLPDLPIPTPGDAHHG